MGKYEWIGNNPKFIDGPSGKLAHISKDNCIRFDSPINVFKDDFTIAMCFRVFVSGANKMVAICNLSEDFIVTTTNDDESSSTIFFMVTVKDDEFYLYGGLGNGTASDRYITKMGKMTNIEKVKSPKDPEEANSVSFICLLIESSNEVVNVYVNNEKIMTLDYKNEKNIPRVPRKYMSFGDSKFVNKYTDEKGFIQIDNIRLYDKILDEDTKKCIAETFCGVDVKKNLSKTTP